MTLYSILEYPGVEFAKVDVDHCGSISQDNNVRAMPTFILFKNGRKVTISYFFSNLRTFTYLFSSSFDLLCID